jgi:integrase/recombinase XerD
LVVSMTRTPWLISREMFLSLQEVERLLDHVRRRVAEAKGRRRMTAELDELIIELLLFSGVRTSEFCRLQVGDAPIRASDAVLLVRQPRGDGRAIHVPRRVCRLIRRYVERVRPNFLPPGVEARDSRQPLAFNEHRRPFERTGLYRRVVRILAGADLGDRASVQLLRHTYGYLAYVRTGGNLLFVQRQLGHAHPMITSIYAQFAEESYAGMADLVGGADRPATPARSPRRKKVPRERKPIRGV